MGLLDTSLQIGRSAIMAHSLAMDVVGNNIANAGTEGYARQVVDLRSVQGIKTIQGPYLGLGVNAENVRRLSDIYVEQRLRDARSALESYASRDEIFQRLEAVFNELTDSDLSTAMNNFFNALATLEGNPEEVAVRRAVVEAGITFTDAVRYLREKMDNLRQDVNSELAAGIASINAINTELADLNVEISALEAGGAKAGSATALRDRRDLLLGQLADLIDVRVIELDTGAINVFVGSDPLVMNSRSFNLALEGRVDRTTMISDIVFAADNRPADFDGGKLHGLVTARDDIIPAYIDDLDAWAAGFIEGFNRIHASGQGLDRFSSITGASGVTDPAAALNAAGLDFVPNTGTFVVNVRNSTSGETSSFRIHVDLDGLEANDTTLNSLVASINAALAPSFPQVQAALGTGNTLRIASSAPELQFSFSDDSSGALAALGVNTFLTGHDSTDIALNSTIEQNPALIAAADTDMPGDNANITRLIDFQRVPIASLGGTSVEAFYQSLVSKLGVESAAAQDRHASADAIKASVQSQREVLSGVSLDEEAVKLIRYQSGYAAAARFISTVDELIQVLLNM